MKVSIIGYGNVATILGRKIIASGHEVVQVVGRDIEKAKSLAEKLFAKASNFTDLPDSKTELFIIALSDSGIQECFSFLKSSAALVVHTAGSVSKDVLQNISAQYGVLYPLQSLRKEMDQIPAIPILIDANSEKAIQTIKLFAESISNQVCFSNDEERLKLHVAAVFVNNFTNHLYHLAEIICKKEKIDFELLKPLMQETLSRLNASSPEFVQTGPAIRKDMSTLEKHLNILNEFPQHKTVYQTLTESIMLHYS